MPLATKIELYQLRSIVTYKGKSWEIISLRGVSNKFAEDQMEIIDCDPHYEYQLRPFGAPGDRDMDLLIWVDSNDIPDYDQE